MIKKNVDVTIAIVNFRTQNFLRKCIKSIYRYSTNFTFEIIIADNASHDGSVEMMKQEFPEIKLLVNNKNIFATQANNQILKKAGGKYCLILNPDIEFVSNAIYEMMDFLEKNPSVAGATCRHILPSGKIDIICSNFYTPIYELVANCILFKYFPFRKKIISKFRFLSWKRKDNRQVRAVSDVILLIRTNILKQVGFYDEHIKLYFMEDDLSVKINKIGYQLWYLGKISVRHLKGASTRLYTPQKMYDIYESDMLFYYGKYYGKIWNLVLRICFISNRYYYSLLSYLLINLISTSVVKMFELNDFNNFL